MEKYQELKVMSPVNRCQLLLSKFLSQFVDYASSFKGAAILLPFSFSVFTCSLVEARSVCVFSLQASGKLDKFVAKRRQKNAAKDHRYVPYKRPEA